MSVLKTALKAVQPALERALSGLDRAFSGYVQPRRARGKLILQPYVGWGTPVFVELTGRVLLPRALAPARTADPHWHNFRNILRRLLSREVGGVQVTGTLGEATASGVSDADGYFTLVFEPGEGGPFSEGWHEARLSIGGRPGRTRADVQVIGKARFGVISDLDDTVIRSDVTSVPRMLLTSLTGNARTRLPFPGVSALYRALTRDLRGGEETRNPIFYVSSSPWNFFDLLWQFLDYRRIPPGPLFLRNWGVELLRGHGGHKHEVIERLFSRFPELNFVLIGDSGEQDPEIYAEVVRRHPGRVLGVYIRDVTETGRDEGVRKLREEVRQAGVDLVLAADTLNAATHAMALGLIRPGELRSVAASVTRRTKP
ncbi:App1 family protein [Deinococcus hopiensis]|uniref:Phosphatidate phosphatase APP1 n=1 Tax=Deinococcus hopiensis KR-140 TaxID=695939 RepID=A0A1W1VNW2_9DEIO|nr:phosphatase domain-containing protein [Deinococcus hopiensis]SMB95028.1 Phosphatidate phosphatase APP1 [Deinococcus hopiensis KR-140]